MVQLISLTAAMQVVLYLFETGGRLGNAGVAALVTLATGARLANSITTGRPLWCRWRTELESVVLFTGADVALLGLGDAASTLGSTRRRRATAPRNTPLAAPGAAHAGDDGSGGLSVAGAR